MLIKLHDGIGSVGENKLFLLSVSSFIISTSEGVLIPHASLEWQHEFMGETSILGQSIYLRAPNLKKLLPINERKNSYKLGVGVSVVLLEGRSTFLDLESRLGDAAIEDYIVKAGFRWEFGLNHKN